MNKPRLMLSHVREHYDKVPMYARMGYYGDGSRMEDFPLIDKDDVIENDTGVISPEAVPLYYQGKLLRQRTSGSTGK